MHVSWEQDGGWFDRSYTLVAEGDVVEELSKSPSLIELREAEREYSERIDLWQSGLLCGECGNEINGRFGATPAGSIICWKCAVDAQQSEQGKLTVNSDPVQATLSESHLYKKSLCDYVINVATGCRHGCKFCYVPTTPGVKNRSETLQSQAGVEDVQDEWGSYLLYRDDLPERLSTELKTRDTWKNTERGRGIVMLSSGTDCYQDRRTAHITHACIRELLNHGRKIRVLSRSPTLVRDTELFKEAGQRIAVGSSIPTMNDDLARAIEPNAPSPSARWRALDELHSEGVPLFVSMSPTYPTMGEDEIWETLTYLKCLDPSVIFHEPINPRGKNFDMCIEAAKDTGFDELADALARLQDHNTWVEYAVEQIDMVQRLAEEIGGLNIHSWPDSELIKSTSGKLRFQLSEMRSDVSPEAFNDDEETDMATSQRPLDISAGSVSEYTRSD